MSITLIAAMTPNRVIGANNKLLWNLPGDLAWFKEQTTGGVVLMGSKTHESIGRPLPNRKNVVVSREAIMCEGAETWGCLHCALSRYKNDNLFVIGGGEIYKQTMPLADRLIITEVHCLLEGDTYFPQIDPNFWRVTSVESHPADEKNMYSRTNYIYKRI